MSEIESMKDNIILDMGCLKKEAKKTRIPSPLQSSDLCTMHYRQAYSRKMKEEELLYYKGPKI